MWEFGVIEWLRSRAETTIVSDSANFCAARQSPFTITIVTANSTTTRARVVQRTCRLPHSLQQLGKFCSRSQKPRAPLKANSVLCNTKTV